MPGIPKLPPVGTGLDAVSDVARRRAQGWSMFGRMFAAPVLGWVDELRSGQVRSGLEVAVGWRAGELKDFGPPMLVLGAFERSARRRTPEVDLERLTIAFAALGDSDVLLDAHATCELLQKLGADESMAWSTGQLAQARDLRVRQDRELRGEAGERLEQACGQILDGRPREPYGALGQLCRLWVDRERAGSSFADGS